MDTTNDRYQIGVVGMGFVGQAVARGFTPFADVRTYDIDPKRCANTLDEVLKESEFIFVCLPTPMKEDGECDLSIIEDFFRGINSEAIFIIKSTVPVGTTQRLNEVMFPHLRIVHSPEFLTARTSLIDFITPARNIVGGRLSCNTGPVRRLYEDRFTGIPCLVLTSHESELIKYMANCFFAVKVIFFNEMKLMSERVPDIRWDKLLNGLMTDGRIGLSHHEVPGHDGQRGFGGTCFPKDINAMIKQMESVGLDPKLLKAAWEQNKEIREVHDWNDNPSAVSRRTSRNG